MQHNTKKRNRKTDAQIPEEEKIQQASVMAIAQGPIVSAPGSSVSSKRKASLPEETKSDERAQNSTLKRDSRSSRSAGKVAADTARSSSQTADSRSRRSEDKVAADTARSSSQTADSRSRRSEDAAF